MESDLFLRKYKKVQLLKAGPFKDVWLVKHIITKERFVIKVDKKIKASKQTEAEAEKSPIFKEAKFLDNVMGHLGFPLMIWSGSEGKIKMIIVEELGCTLWNRFHIACGKQFSLKTICHLGKQIIQLLEAVHHRGFTTGKLTANSLQFGKGKNSHKLFLNDLSTCNKVGEVENAAMPKAQTFPFPPSPNSTINAILQSQSVSLMDCESPNTQQSDMEAVLGMMIEFFGVKAPENNRILTKKIYSHKNITGKTTVQKIPQQFFEMLENCRDNDPEEPVCHFWYISQINKAMYRNNIEMKNCYDYDWIKSRKIIESLRVNIHIPNLETQHDIQILNSVYEPLQRSITIDDIRDKYYEKFDGDAQSMLGSALQSNSIQSKDIHGNKLKNKILQCTCQII